MLELDPRYTYIFVRDAAEESSQYEALHTFVRPENFDGMAFNIDLTSKELSFQMVQNPNFLEIYRIATHNCCSWAEARKIFWKNIQDMVSNYQNSNKPKASYPKEPGPGRVYTNSYKSRGGPTRVQLTRQMAAYLKWKEIDRAVNNSDLDRHD